MGMAGSTDSGPALELGVTVFDASRGQDNAPDPATARPLKAGDVVTACRQFLKFQLTNHGDQPVDATLFYLDAGFGLTPLLPPEDADLDNRIPAGGTRAVGPFKLNDEATGWESALVIGTPATTPPQNFKMLAQPSLPQTRGIESPLDALLRDAAFGRGQTRSAVPAIATSAFVVKATSWQTLPPK
jgi:hypothetical protein